MYLEPALACVLDVVENVRVLDNDPRAAAVVAMEREGRHEVVYPLDLAGLGLAGQAKKLRRVFRKWGLRGLWRIKRSERVFRSEHMGFQRSTEMRAANVQPWQTVVGCYSAVDRFFPACGLYDLTEGVYHGDPDTPLEQAQASQHDYLLDQIECGRGRRVLDIGCGYGTLLERIRQRGAAGVGITLSPEQARHCRRQKLDAFVLDYRAIPGEWDRTFDAVIANGTIEHFVRPADVAAGRADAIYRHLFARVHRLIDPDSAARRFATTTIHVLRKPADPRNLLKSPLAFRKGSDDFHWAVLEQGWGGYYPKVGQLRRCAEGYFDLIEEVDGTEDYRLTSEEWLRRVRRALRSPRVMKIALRSLPVLARSPRQFLLLLLGFLASQSWNWQFRPPNAPTRLLRQTWAYRERP